MTRLTRMFLLVFALGIAVPAFGPAGAAAADLPQADVGVPRPILKPVMKWLKENWKLLYIAFDELIDDLTGCSCNPPHDPSTEPAPEPEPWRN